MNTATEDTLFTFGDRPIRYSDHPWLRKDTLFAAANSGVLISNATTGFEISGQHAYDFFVKISSFLNGDVTVGQLRQALPDRTWNMLLDVLEPLTNYGFLRWIPDRDFNQCDKQLCETYADQIAFLAQFTDEPHQAFLNFHLAKIALLGEGPLLDSLKENLIENGAAHLISSNTIDHLKNSADEVDLVVVGPDSLIYLDELKNLSDRILVICPAGDYLIALPVKWQRGDYGWQHGDISLGLGSRSQLWASAFARARLGTPEWTAQHSEAIQRLFGALLAYEVFKGISRAIKPETGRNVFSLHCLTGETSVHPVHLFINEVEQHYDEISSGKQTFPLVSDPKIVREHPRLTVDDSQAEDYSLSWSGLVDDFTMPAWRFQDAELNQIPVKVSSVETANGLISAMSAWTTADARIEALARSYSFAFTRLEQARHKVDIIFGLGRNESDATRRCLENFWAGQSLDTHEAIAIPSLLDDRLGEFVSSTTDGGMQSIQFESYYGFYAVQVLIDGKSAIGVDVTPAAAQARAVISCLGRKQLSSGDEASVPEEFSRLARTDVGDLQVHTSENSNGWFLTSISIGDATSSPAHSKCEMA